MRYSFYNLEKTKEDCTYLMNTRSGAVVKIDEPACLAQLQQMKRGIFNTDNYTFAKQLEEYGFISTAQSDAQEYAQAREAVAPTFNGKDNVRFTLIVTEDCNFHCQYCYEAHEPRRMQANTYDRILRHIEKGLLQGDYHHVQVDFFGGEPLLAYSQILIFLQSLQAVLAEYPGTSFRSTIVTNGYLLSKERYWALSKLGVDHFQVTVDGTQEKHDRYRPLKNGAGSWEKVVHNLEEISHLPEGAHISLRTNLNDDILSDYYSFLKLVREKLYNPRLVLELSWAKAFTPLVNPDAVNHAGKTQQAKKLLQVLRQARSLGLRVLEQQEPFLGCMACAVALPHSFVVDPENRLSKCTVHFQEKWAQIGTLQPDGTLAVNPLAHNWEKSREQPACEDCRLFPLCAGHSCPAAAMEPDGHTRAFSAFCKQKSGTQWYQDLMEGEIWS